MKKHLISALIFASVFVPSVAAFAQTATVNMSSTLPVCITIDRNLSLGANDLTLKTGEVTALQNILNSLGYLKVKPTGYFGSITMQAVKSFQKANSISTSGFVGVLTRAKVNTFLCQNQRPPVNAIQIVSPTDKQVWKQGTTQNIIWTDRNVYIQAQKYDISIAPKSICVTGKACPYFMIKPYTIATSTTLSSNGYSWLVGTTPEAGRTIPDGDYTITVCMSGGTFCAQSGVVTLSTSTTSTLDSVINFINPSTGIIGTKVTLTGKNLNAVDHINFGYGYIPKNAISTELMSQQQSLTFTVPSSLTPACYYAAPVHCAIPTVITQPAPYNVSVTMADGRVTNTVPFTVTAN